MNTITQTIQGNKDNRLEQTISNMPLIKAKMKATWQDGNYANFATYMEAGAIDILERWRITPLTTLLDIGCGAGQTAIPASRLGIDVTGIDIAENLIEYAKERAQSEGVSAHFDVGDVENLPYDDAQFDAIISLIGAMFAPDYDKTASEIARVCKSGGQLHMANWTPGGFAGSMFKCVAKYMPPAASVEPPTLWGIEDKVVERLGEHFTNFQLKHQYYPRWTYPFDSDQTVDLFRKQFGPVKRAFDSLDKKGQNALLAELRNIFQAHNIASDNSTEIRGEYLNISAIRK